MPVTTIGFFAVDFLVRPFARIFQKMPGLTCLIICLLYGAIAYVVWRSAFKETNEHQPY
ncbi:MAG: hypothetical protein IPP57_02665 [Candidatus Obscuribacter sp.]|jgi:hypothetical protein|nr:hypothetical protein [Candidatus Obscuribacter sp.]MDQ5967998.1 hypothetical protein [Cyanobacteriota bacterium erpe_2018_sw_39hr_WHONDRS-SW48-000098_B_bin.30]MBK7839645.1 hypothetical protein [Candidatus Obscuribacter sp.]MBK9202344.1 hypothetical protein [Candidatus Obscuribacter sp.]MBK9618859.1 hypothetical protein [Candidatus Obscuribacter sp.]